MGRVLAEESWTKMREWWSFSTFESLLQDGRYALRAMRRSPGYFAVMVATLALAIAATAAIFSVVYSVLLRPLPYPQQERLVWMGESTGKAEGISVTWINFEHWREENHSFDDMAAFEMQHFTLTGHGEPLFTRAAVVSSGFFGLTGAKPMLGRVFETSDDRHGAAPVVVLNYQFWAEKLGADPRVVGTTLNLNGKPWEVIGVLAPGPQFFPKAADFYIPLASLEGGTVNRGKHGSIRVLARLKAGITLQAGTADLNRIMKRLAQEDPGPENDHRAYGQFLTQSETHEIRPTLLMLFGAVCMVLLIASANVASLILARSTQRVREMALRVSLGAGRGRLRQQLLTENVVMAVLGGLFGLLFAYVGLRVLIHAAPVNLPRVAEVRLDGHVLLFAAAVTLLTGLLVGLAPVVFSGRFDLIAALNSDTRSATGARASQSLRSILVVAEIALTLVLSFVANLFIRSLLKAETGDPGFEPNQVLALELVLPAGSYKSRESVESFYRQLEGNLKSLPGVSDVGAVGCPPSAGDCGDWFYSVVGEPAPPREDVPIALFNTADSDYFHAMRIPVREGRAFRESDRGGAARVAIVNQTFARKWWHGGSAIGHEVKSGAPYLAGPLYEIVGVVGSVSQMGLDSEPLPEIYLPFAQSPSAAMVVMVRTKGRPEQLMSAVRHELARLDPMLPVESLRPLTETLSGTLNRRRFITGLLGLFALLAMVLAVVGIYGLLSYWVSVREDDIAIRVALGAQRSAIFRLVGSHAVRLIAAGSVMGALGSAWASRPIESLLFNTSANLAGASIPLVVLAALCLSVALIPIWRATRVDLLKKLHRA